MSEHPKLLKTYTLKNLAGMEKGTQGCLGFLLPVKV